MLSFLDSNIERFNPGGSNNFYAFLEGGSDPWHAWDTPQCMYNHMIRHPNNSTNLAFLDGHVQNVPNTDWGLGLSLRPAMDAGVFVVKKTD